MMREGIKAAETNKSELHKEQMLKMLQNFRSKVIAFCDKQIKEAEEEMKRRGMTIPKQQ